MSSVVSDSAAVREGTVWFEAFQIHRGYFVTPRVVHLGKRSVCT